MHHTLTHTHTFCQTNVNHCNYKEQEVTPDVLIMLSLPFGLHTHTQTHARTHTHTQAHLFLFLNGVALPFSKLFSGASSLH